MQLTPAAHLYELFVHLIALSSARGLAKLSGLRFASSCTWGFVDIRMAKILKTVAVVALLLEPTSSFLAPPPLGTPACQQGARSGALLTGSVARCSSSAPNARARLGRRGGALVLRGLRCTGKEPEALEVKGADGHPIHMRRILVHSLFHYDYTSNVYVAVIYSTYMFVHM